jgi:hypothetical protein
MRATEPWRFARMRRGWGSRSLILDCSIEGPRGAKPRPSEQVDVVGDGGAERPPFPWPSRTVSISALVAGGCSAVQCGAARTLEKLGQRRVFMYDALHLSYYRMVRVRVVWLARNVSRLR